MGKHSTDLCSSETFYLNNLVTYGSPEDSCGGLEVERTSHGVGVVSLVQKLGVFNFVSSHCSLSDKTTFIKFNRLTRAGNHDVFTTDNNNSLARKKLLSNN